MDVTEILERPCGTLSLKHWLFDVGDFSADQQAQNLTRKLAAEGDPLSEYLRSKLTKTQPLLAAEMIANQSAETLGSALADDFNVLLKGPSLYNQTRFESITLRVETKVLLVQEPTGNELVRLNRRLLEDAYPDDIAKKPNPWTYEEMSEVLIHFYVDRDFFNKGVAYCVRRGIRRERAEEIVQEVFEDVLKKRNYDPQRVPVAPVILRFEAYLWALLRWKVHNELYGQKLSYVGFPLGLTFLPPNIISLIDLEKCWGELTEREQEVLELRYVEGFSGKEVAKQLELTPGNVRQIASRAREKLIHCLTAKKQHA